MIVPILSKAPGRRSIAWMFSVSWWWSRRVLGLRDASDDELQCKGADLCRYYGSESKPAPDDTLKLAGEWMLVEQNMITLYDFNRLWPIPAIRISQPEPDPMGLPRDGCRMEKPFWLVVTGCHEFYFPIYWVANHPNWLFWFGCHFWLIFPLILGISSSQLTNSYFSEGWLKTTNQLWFGVPPCLKASESTPNFYPKTWLLCHAKTSVLWPMCIFWESIERGTVSGISFSGMWHTVCVCTNVYIYIYIWLYNIIQYNIIQFNIISYDMIQYNMIYDTIKYDSI